MNIAQIVREYLEQNGYSGLVDDYRECGCGIDDLMPCDDPPATCEAAYREACTAECGHGFEYHPGDFHFTTRRPESANIAEEEEAEPAPHDTNMTHRPPARASVESPPDS